MAFEPFPTLREEVTLHCTFTQGSNNDVPLGDGNDFGNFLGVKLLEEESMNSDVEITGFDITSVPEERRSGRRILLCFEFGVQMTLHILPNSSASAEGNRLLIGQDVTGDGTIEYSHDMWDGYCLEFVYNDVLGAWCMITPAVPF